MIHFCPQCEDEAENKPPGYKDCMETYGCERCKDTYCVHFMKSNGPEYVCWVCGSEKLESTFNKLVEQWHKDTGYHNNGNIIHSHPAYVALVAIGKPAIPLIIKEMKKGTSHWFRPIRDILGDSPEIPEEHRGRVRIMEGIYLDWLAKRGYK